MKECNQCGKCCIKYGNGGLSASAAEIEFWEIFRPEIAEYVSDGKIWISPKTGEQLDVCPWMRKLPDQEKYTCDIYFDRPDDCKFYPVTIAEMIRDDCEMLDEHDIANPEKAQTLLDKLMADSRSSFE